MFSSKYDVIVVGAGHAGAEGGGGGGGRISGQAQARYPNGIKYPVRHSPHFDFLYGF